MCTVSRTAIGIRKTGIMELMICTVKPRPMSAPMPQITLNIATTIGGMISESLRNINQSRRKITIIASGAMIPICRNISNPKVSSATGNPAM